MELEDTTSRCPLSRSRYLRSLKIRAINAFLHLCEYEEGLILHLQTHISQPFSLFDQSKFVTIWHFVHQLSFYSSRRLLRRMRAFASGLGASSDQTPVRLLHLSPKAVGLLRAYRHDSSWSVEALLAMEEGGTAAASLVGWARELERVHREQPRVRDFLRFVAGVCCLSG